MLLIHLYSNLIGVCEERNGKPRHTRDRKTGYEIHHIIARSMGGTNHAYNLVYLTPREHYTAHHILARIYGGPLASAFWRMCHTSKKYKFTARQYQTAKNLQREFMSVAMKDRKIPDHIVAKIKETKSKNKYKTSEKTKELLREIGKRNGFKPEVAEINRARMTGRIMPEETKAKISEAMKRIGTKLTTEKPLATCPHCNLTGGLGAMKRWHFDNCKSR